MPKYLLTLSDQQMQSVRARSEALGVSLADVFRLAVHKFLEQPATSGCIQLGNSVLISGGFLSVRIGG